MTKEHQLTSTTPQANTSLLALWVGLVVNGMAHAYLMITLPGMGRQMSLADLDTSLIASVSALLVIVAAPVWGTLCESKGRRWVLGSGLFFGGVCTLGLGLVLYFAPVLIGSASLLFSLLLTLRCAQTLLSAGIKPASQAIMADTSDPSGRPKAMAMMGAAFGTGTILGGLSTVISGTDYLLHGVVVMAIALLISSITLFKCLKETACTPAQTTSPTQTTSLSLSVKSIWPYLVTTMIGLTVYSGLQQITSWRLQDQFEFSLHQSVQFTGAIMMSTMLLMILTQAWLVGRLGWGGERLRLWGAGLATLFLMAAALAPAPPLLLVAMAGLGLSIGLMLPGNLALMSLGAPSDQQGKVAGINGVFQGLGLALGPAAATSVFQLNPSLPYWGFAALMLCVVIHSALTGYKKTN